MGLDPLRIEGWMSEGELAWLAEQAAGKMTVVEMGSYKGRSAMALLSRMPVGAMLHAVDAWWDDKIYAAFRTNLREHLDAGRVTMHRATTSQAFGSLVGIEAEMVFIDAGHDYDNVVGDIQLARILMPRGGLLCGHDYCDQWPDVPRAVRDVVPGFKVVEGERIWYKEVTAW